MFDIDIPVTRRRIDPAPASGYPVRVVRGASQRELVAASLLRCPR